MRISLVLIAAVLLIACKEARHPRMAQTKVVNDTLVVDGPCVVTNLKYIIKMNGWAENRNRQDSLTSAFKYVHQFLEKDSILVIDTKYTKIKVIDFFGEFPDQVVNLEEYKTPLAFIYPGTELMVLEDWSSKIVLSAAAKGDRAAVKEEWARLDSIKNATSISQEEITAAASAEKLERIRIEEEAKKQLKEVQKEQAKDRVDIGKK